jgi:antitoxin (DNA-binding transcriptional repressor) of toxin-antitoxin stability system
MKIVNIHEAKTHLSKLVAAGEPFVIARAGKPLAQVTPVAPAPRPSRLGALAGRAQVPEDFDRMAADEIAALFAGDAAPAPLRPAG